MAINLDDNQRHSFLDEKNYKSTIESIGSINYPKWENYPLNLNSDYDVSILYLESYHDLLSKELPRITSEDTEVETITVEHKCKNQFTHFSIESPRDLSDHLTRCMSLMGPISSFYFIRPVFSFDQLEISGEVLKKLLTFHKNSPLLLDVLSLFGEKTEAVNEEYPVYWEEYKPDNLEPLPEEEIDPFTPNTTEVGYNIKYVEKRTDHTNPTKELWVTRKMGVSAKHFSDTGNTAWTLVQPCQLFYDRLKKVMVQDTMRRNRVRRQDVEIHLLAFESANQNWTSYINDLERDFIDMDKKAFCWRPSIKDAKAYKLNPDSQGLQFEDTQRIQRLKDLLLQVAHSLQINLDNLKSLRKGWPQLYTNCRNAIDIDTRFANLELRISQKKFRTESLIKRVNGLLSVIPAMLARRENTVMRMLSEKATEYSRSMKVITIFTLCYLPPSFVATFFGMSLWGQTPFGQGLKFGEQLAYFFALSLILVVVTFGCWRWWELRKLTKQKLPDVEKGQHSD